jgi:tetratricopeptide (TPR) repeat protein
VRIQNFVLKMSGGMRASGWVFAILGGLWIAFAAHSGFVQWHRAWGRHFLNKTEATHTDVMSGAFRVRTYSDAHRAAAAKMFRHFSLAERWGLVSVVEVKLGLAWSALLRDDFPTAKSFIRQAIRVAPRQVDLRQDLFEILMAEQRLPEAADALAAKLALGTPSAEEHFQLAGLLAETDRLADAAKQYEACLALAPDNGAAHYNYGALLRRLGRADEAVEHLRTAHRIAPQDPDTLVEFGLALVAAHRNEEALEALRTAVALNPESPESQNHLAPLIRQLESDRTPTSPPTAP